ncbi:CHAT domain-containing protein [Austwickia sp. TVS 96-490-7B]|uniref:CHAT domain-containing protein n=1 Tax=Austwickia sp. TVS 96-490-7B TaxID=2830843 RepID=UPI001C56ED93|nr:CHAT domain-containing protein [Austwickia sp. TVS 96-490-7B]
MTEDPPLLAEQVNDLLDQARIAFNGYHLDDGHRCLLHAQELATTSRTSLPHDLLMRLRLTATWVTFDREGPAAALAELDRISEESTEATRTDLIAASDVQRGILRARCGDITGALDALRRAEEYRLDMPLADQVRLVMHRGILHHQCHDIAAARTDFDTAATLADEAGLTTLWFKARHNQGCAAFIQGDLPEALRLMDDAARTGIAMNCGITLLDRARVLCEAGLIREAAEAFHESAAAFTADGVHREVTEIDVDLARCELLLGDPLRAARRAEHAVHQFHRRHEPWWENRARLVQLQAAAYAADLAATPPDLSCAARAQSAHHLINAATAIGDSDTAAAARLELAEALCDGSDNSHDPIHAAHIAARVLDDARSLTQSPHVTARLGYAHARIRVDLARGRIRAARARLARAADDLANTQSRIAGLDARTALAVHARRLADLDLGLAYNSGRPWSVLHRLERWRRAIDPLVPVHPPPDAEEAFLLSRLRQARDDLAHADSTTTAQARADVRRLERATAATRWRARCRLDNVTAHGPSHAEIVDAVTTTHRHGTTVLALLHLHHHVMAVISPPTGNTQMVDLGPADQLWRQIDRVSNDIDAVVRVADDPFLTHLVSDATRRSLSALDELLVPAIQLAGSSSLVVLGGDLFGVIPWGMLPSRRGYPTTLAPSLLSWSRQLNREEQQQPRPPRIVSLHGPGLPHAPAEIRRVLTVWTGQDTPPPSPATRDDLLAGLSTADIVHIAAHGDHHRRSPLFSSLRLADGPFFAHELESRTIRASLVVLSACDTGRGTARPGEEPLGWPSALLALGVHTVIAPLTPVRDEQTAAVMVQLHQGLADGSPADQALALAASTLPLGTPFTCFGGPWQRHLPPPRNDTPGPAPITRPGIYSPSHLASHHDQRTPTDPPTQRRSPSPSATQ